MAGTAHAASGTGQGLSAKQAAIIPIAAFTAKGDIDKLKVALNEGLDNGAFPGAENQLRSHLNVSMNVGLTEAQMRDVVKVLGAKVGKAESDSAAKMLEVVLTSRADAAKK